MSPDHLRYFCVPYTPKHQYQPWGLPLQQYDMGHVSGEEKSLWN